MNSIYISNHTSIEILKKYQWCHQKARAVLSHSARCSETNKNFYSIPCIIPERKINRLKGKLSGDHKFFISGIISKDKGIEMVLDVFKNVPKAHLTITGKARDDVMRRSSLCHNINCGGYIKNSENFLRILSEADYSRSWRNPSQPVNQYNIPSKILETLAGNRTAVISTIKYEELEGVNYFYEDYDREKQIVLIRDIVAGKYDIETSKCLDNSDVLIAKYSENAWIRTLIQIENL